MHEEIPVRLRLSELRAVAGYAAACARDALALFEQVFPADPRPRAAIDAAQAFADGAQRTKAIRDAAWAAQRAAHAARDGGHGAASLAARAALAAAGAAFLHPLPKPTQVKHILGSAACAVCAHELAGNAGSNAAGEHLSTLLRLACADVVGVLTRYPPAPPGGGRVGQLIRQIDAELRTSAAGTAKQGHPAGGAGPDRADPS